MSTQTPHASCAVEEDEDLIVYGADGELVRIELVNGRSTPGQLRVNAVLDAIQNDPACTPVRSTPHVIVVILERLITLPDEADVHAGPIVVVPGDVDRDFDVLGLEVGDDRHAAGERRPGLVRTAARHEA